MSFDVDEDILQDFLVEAGEILEQLQEQLVDLENNPEDADLLNAIFRGYHTVKGGAGFLSLTELVEICHGAENVFDVMRNGQRTLTPELMDIILQATDVVVEMFERVKARDPLEPADAHLVDLLHKLSRPESPDENIFGEQSAPASEPEPAIEEPELVVITCFIPKNSLRRFSNSLLNLPVVNQKSRDDETSICISASPKTFPDTGIKDFPGINGFSA